MGKKSAVKAAPERQEKINGLIPPKAGRPYTFPKQERLLKKWEFQRVYSENKKYAGSYLIIHILPYQSSRKAGIIVHRKIGNAVKRNRAKRLIREAYRLNKHLLPNNLHIVITARPEINGLKYKNVEEDMLKICKEAELL